MSRIDLDFRPPIADTPLDSPAEVMARLDAIEVDLALRQGPYERAAGQWYAAQREIKRAYAVAFLKSDGSSVAAQKADADLAALACDAGPFESEFESLKAVIRVLEQRSMILMSLLRAQGRA